MIFLKTLFPRVRFLSLFLISAPVNFRFWNCLAQIEGKKKKKQQGNKRRSKRFRQSLGSGRFLRTLTESNEQASTYRVL